MQRVTELYRQVQISKVKGKKILFSLKTFYVDHFQSIELLQHCLYFMFWFFSHEEPRGMWDLSSPTRDQTHTPYNRRRSLNHWTTREVPEIQILS